MKKSREPIVILCVLACVALAGCGDGQGNHAPVAEPQSISTPKDTPLEITLTATDEDTGDLLTWTVAEPTHGSLTGTAPDLTYTPEAGYVGSDGFTFHVNDGTVDSNTADVSIYVGVPLSALSTAPEDGELDVALDVVVSVTFDEDVDPTSVTESTFYLGDEEGGSVAGTLSVSGDTVSFTPAADLLSRPYTATVTTGVRDYSGRSLAADLSLGFTTVLHGDAEVLGSPGKDCVDPSLAVDQGTGNAIAVWVAKEGEHENATDGDVYSYGGIWASLYTAAGGWDTAQQISASTDAADPQAAFYDAGKAVVVWEQGWDAGYGMWLAIQKKLYGSAGWEAGEETANTGDALQSVKDPVVAVDPTHMAFVFWEQRQDGDQQSILVQRTQLVPDSEVPEEVTADFGNGYGYAEHARVAFDADGSAMLVWATDYDYGGPDEYRLIRARRYVAGTGWEGGASTPVFTSPSAVGAYADKPEIASDLAGVYAVVWQQSGTAEGAQDAYACRYATTWGAPVKLSSVGSSGASVDEALVVMSVDGSAVASWVELASDQSSQIVRASRYLASWGTADQVYSPLSGFAALGGVVMDSSGAAHVLCAGFDTVSSALVARLVGVTYDAGWHVIGQLSPAVPVDYEEDVGTPVLRTAPGGYAVAACPAKEDVYYRILAIRYIY